MSGKEKPMRILVVDDDDDIRLTLSTVLEAWGHQVLTAEDPMKAISLLTVADVDALVLDVVMPRFTGYELLEILRRDVRNRMLPVLLMSAHGETRERIHGIRLGASDFLPKPFDPEELVVRVERMVSQRAVSPGGMVGDLKESGLIRVLQSLEHEDRSGVLRLVSARRNGWIELKLGRLLTCNYGLLEGVEALFSMLALEESRFSFEPFDMEDREATDFGKDFHLANLFLKFAQYQDELARYRHFLPNASAGLFAAKALNPGTELLMDLPYLEVYERIETLPGISLDELIAHQFASSVKVRLAAATLARGSVIKIRSFAS